jgi:glycosyltransferase involved in cell wall biosynthesis
MPKKDKLPISALIVSFNEADVLERCLNSIQFCDEIIVYDLGSSDNSVEVAKSLGATVKKHARVPHAEVIYAKALSELKYDWVLLTDPDEELSSVLKEELFEKFNKLPPKIAAVRVPMQYFFKSHALRGTIWGGISHHRFLVNRKRAYFRPLVNTAVFIKDGYELQVWPYRGGLIYHYWMRGYREFLSKHRRYLKQEAYARYERGERSSYLSIVFSPWRSFRESFLTKKGYHDGLLGFFLSLFWAWYNTNALIRLKREQIKRGV